MKSKSENTQLTSRQILDKQANEIWAQLVDRINEKKQYEPFEIDSLWVKLINTYETKDYGENERELKNVRNHRWTINHLKIKQTIDNYVRDHFIMPSAYEIAQHLGLSRQTVSNHFREFETHELYAEEMKKLEYSSTLLLERVLSIAVKGDLKAMKFFVSVMERRKQLKQASTTTNFIQINNIYINESTIKALPEDKRQAIEEIILSENMKILKSGQVGKV